MSDTSNGEAMRLLAEIIKEQSQAYRDLAEAISTVLGKTETIKDGSLEIKTLLGIVKDKSEEIHRLFENLQTGQAQLSDAAGDILTQTQTLSASITTSTRELTLLIDKVPAQVKEALFSTTGVISSEIFERMSDFCQKECLLHKELTPKIDAIQKAAESSDKTLGKLDKTLERSVKDGINGTLLSVIKKKWFWVALLGIFLSYLLAHGLVSSIRIGDLFEVETAKRETRGEETTWTPEEETYSTEEE